MRRREASDISSPFALEGLLIEYICKRETNMNTRLIDHPLKPYSDIYPESVHVTCFMCLFKKIEDMSGIRWNGMGGSS